METVIFTQRVETIESYNERRDCADQRIAHFIRTCGYLALPVPNSTEGLAEIINQIKPVGIVLTGGNSLLKYGGNAPERDETDFKLIQLAENQKIPLFGFCRGMQSILDYYGNPLENISGHAAKRHMVYGKDGMFEVNSYHNQACMNVKEGNELKRVAWTEDGVVEAVSHVELPIMGIMWHPEREAVYAGHDIKRIRDLFQ